MVPKLHIPEVLENKQNTNTVLTLHSRLVPFEDVDVILQLSELFLHFLKNSFNLLLWSRTAAVVDVYTTLLCDCSVISWLS